jgi:hypothetical protein
VSPREQIARLEGLLQRIRANAAKVRPSADRRAAAPDITTPVPPKVEVVQPAAVSPFPLAAPTPEAPPVSAAPPVTAAPSVSAPAWRPEPGSSVQSRPPSVPPEELSDDDLLEVTTIPPAAAAAAAEEPANELDVDVSVEEEPPVSSSRSKVAATMDEALASAAEDEDEHEVPVKTPPPESGPQAAGPPSVGLETPDVPDVDALEADMLAPPSLGPTAEQLGETIELEAPLGPTLEIDVSMTDAPEPEPERPPEELEVTLPRGQMPSGLYDLDPASPPTDATPAAPAVEDRTSSVPPEPRPTARPELGAAEIARVVLGNRPTISHTFVDVLDRSLSL